MEDRKVDKIFVVNAGSSSLKYQLLVMPSEYVVCSGVVERIGQEMGTISLKFGKNKEVLEMPIPNHEIGVNHVLSMIKENNIIKDFNEIEAVGHRIVHGGEYFKRSVVINDDVEKAIELCTDLAPLHNPANLSGIKAFQKVVPDALQVAVFDTAFHQTMEQAEFMYPIPYRFYEDYKIRRYGFHGTSHKYVSQKARSVFGEGSTRRIISCHLGNGASVTAIKDGKSVNTSMGFTPLAGLMMGTRSGDIDPALIAYIMEHENLSIDEVMKILNEESGLLGISGISSDGRDVQKGVENGNERALLAQVMFRKHVAAYIGQYFVELGGCDTIIFTAGIGENNARARKGIVDAISEALNIELDDWANEHVSGEVCRISTRASAVDVVVIPTNEEVMIARDTYVLLKENS